MNLQRDSYDRVLHALASRKGWLLLALFGIWALGLHLRYAFLDGGPIAQGQLVGNDAYMRFLRVLALRETADWYDNTIARGNAPFGHELHWTRPLDVLLLGPALLLEPVFDPKKALYWAAVGVPPLLHTMTGFLGVWAVRPVIPAPHRVMMFPLLFTQGAILSVSVAGRADHHVLLALTAVVAVGFMLRLMSDEGRTGMAFAVGAAVAFGVWISPEFMLVLSLCMAAVVVLWLLRGEPWAAHGLRLSLAMFAVGALALAAERPPEALLAVAHDRISVVHIAVFTLAALFWAGAATSRQVGGGPWRRAAYSLGVGGILLAILFAVFPRAYLGPAADVDPLVRTLIVERVGEMQPILGPEYRHLRSFIRFLGAEVVALALPFVVYVLLRTDMPPRVQGSWAFIGISMVILSGVSMLYLRLSIYPGVFIAICLAGLLHAVWHALAEAGSRLLTTCAYLGAVMLILAGPSILRDLVKSYTAGTRPTAVAALACDESAVLNAVEKAAKDGAPQVIMTAAVGAGPLILFNTAHSVVLTPYHRNTQGIRDAYRFWSATDDDSARQIAVDRGIDLVLLCRNGLPRWLGSLGPVRGSLHERLQRGKAVPRWVRPLSTGGDGGGSIRAYEVVVC